MTAAHALAASLSPLPGARLNAGHNVLLHGAAGRIGEAVLVALLAHPAVAHIEVVTTAPLPSSDTKLSYRKLNAARQDAAMQPHVAVLVLGGTPSSYYGRDAVFAHLREAELLATSHRLHQRGVARLVVVAPTAAHLQSVSFEGLVHGEVEMQLVQWFSHLTVIRPADEREVSREGLSFGQRIAMALIDQLKIMIPAHQKTSDKKRVAALVCEAIGQSEPGTRVFNSIDTAAGQGKAPATATSRSRA
jgi:NADPH:quinone reductase-like Zn-dependent oxidoreductase